MHEERLLERIRSTKQEPNRRDSDNQKRYIDSVLLHLRRILNTRQGNVPLAEDYGVPDFLDFLQTYPESVGAIEQNIKSAIDRYEPRLTDARVTFVPDEDETLALRFQIVANLAMEGGRMIFFDTIVDADGRVRIKK